MNVNLSTSTRVEREPLNPGKVSLKKNLFFFFFFFLSALSFPMFPVLYRIIWGVSVCVHVLGLETHRTVVGSAPVMRMEFPGGTAKGPEYAHASSGRAERLTCCIHFGFFFIFVPSFIYGFLSDGRRRPPPASPFLPSHVLVSTCWWVVIMVVVVVEEFPPGGF